MTARKRQKSCEDEYLKMWTNKTQIICMDTSYGPEHYQTGQSHPFGGFGPSVRIQGWNKDQDFRDFNYKSLIIWIMKSILFIPWTLQFCVCTFYFLTCFFFLMKISWAKKNHLQHWAFEFLDSPVCSSIIQQNVIVEFSQHIKNDYMMYMQVINAMIWKSPIMSIKMPNQFIGLVEFNKSWLKIKDATCKRRSV